MELNSDWQVPSLMQLLCCQLLPRLIAFQLQSTRTMKCFFSTHLTNTARYLNAQENPRERRKIMMQDLKAATWLPTIMHAMEDVCNIYPLEAPVQNCVKIEGCQIMA